MGKLKATAQQWLEMAVALGKLSELTPRRLVDVYCPACGDVTRHVVETAGEIVRCTECEQEHTV